MNHLISGTVVEVYWEYIIMLDDNWLENVFKKPHLFFVHSLL